jgi:hypothetical protein
MLTHADVCLGDGDEVSSRCRTHAANAARTHAEPHVSIRQHTSAYVSIRQHAANAARTHAEPHGGGGEEELAAAVARAPSAELVRLLPDIDAARVVACR